MSRERRLPSGPHPAHRQYEQGGSEARTRGRIHYIPLVHQMFKWHDMNLLTYIHEYGELMGVCVPAYDL